MRDAVMFDLDGTLADSLADIAAAANGMLAGFSQPPRPAHEYRYLAGQGVEYLVEHALRGPADDDAVARGVAAVRGYYAKHGHALTQPYPGIPDLLDTLTQRGVTLAVLTNKPHEPAAELVRRLYARWTFAAVRGARPGGWLKPDPAGAIELMQTLAIPAPRWLYVGDTRVDMETGRRAGLFTVGVTWGFRDELELRDSGADAVIHHPMELLDHL